MLKSEREAFADGRQCPVLPRAGQARLGDRSIYLRARNVSLANCVFACLALTAFAGADTPREVNVSDEATRAALQRSVGFLLKDQNPNGSWGSIANALPGYDDIFLNTETQRGWQVATTALACISLQHTTVTSEETWAAYDRGIDFICQNVNLKRPSDWDIDTVWGFVFGMQGLAHARMNPRYKDSPRLAEIIAAGDTLLAKLAKHQTPAGGWGYYEGSAGVTPNPSWATSFTTSSCILGLIDAKKAGFQVDQAMLDRAVRAVRRCRLPNGAYAYSIEALNTPEHIESINNVKGSLGRIQVCNLALRRAGLDISDAQLRSGLDLFFQHHKFLDAARGRPIPHEAYYANAAYFYFFGHYYAAQVIAELPADQQARYWDRLRREVIKTQQSDGSSWDYYMNSYGKPYGTAFASGALTLSLLPSAMKSPP